MNVKIGDENTSAALAELPKQVMPEGVDALASQVGRSQVGQQMPRVARGGRGG